jgi:hypothetical protein
VRRTPARRANARLRTPRGVTALMSCLAFLSACSFGQLQFTVDHRLTFVTPHARELVHAPVKIQWTMKDFVASGLDGSRDKNHGVFAVFVDRAPMPVGKDLKWLARDDAGCSRDARCRSAQYLADQRVYVTTNTSITIAVLPPAPSGVGDEQHYVNVVLLDGTGHRIGESAWYLPFTSKRRSSS